jgi:hypothetical protein
VIQFPESESPPTAVSVRMPTITAKRPKAIRAPIAASLTEDTTRLSGALACTGEDA